MNASASSPGSCISLLERQRSSTGVFIVLLRCHATRPIFFRFPPIRVDDYELRRAQDKALRHSTKTGAVLHLDTIRGEHIKMQFSRTNHPI